MELGEVIFFFALDAEALNMHAGYCIVKQGRTWRWT
jgi:hypothetical protein